MGVVVINHPGQREPEGIVYNTSRLDLGAKLGTLDDAEFLALCQHNEDVRLETTKEGDLLVMPGGTGWRTGRRNSRLTRRLDAWAEQDDSGYSFDSSTLFRLPNGARRSPDASWVIKSRCLAAAPHGEEKVLPLCPDFVAEILSLTDSLSETQAKMAEYRDNGARLGWLIDPRERRVHIYRPGLEAETLDNPATVSGEFVLPGFALNLSEIWG